ncbi:hypothetical protein JTB14_026968 [Gonioctena quinquepunctata]|nr:hypothetical protein JTB14_026968 [Gonioctena quinquepunctata]
MEQSAQVNSCYHITNWEGFQNSLENAYCASEDLNTTDEIDTAIAQFETTILDAITNNTIKMQPAATSNNLPEYIKDEIEEKNRARATIQRTLAREHKTIAYNKNLEVKNLINQYRNDKWKESPSQLDPKDPTESPGQNF